LRGQVDIDKWIARDRAVQGDFENSPLLNCGRGGDRFGAKSQRQDAEG